MKDPTHYPLSETLKGIRQRARVSVETLASQLEVPEERIRRFEQDALPDSVLMDAYARLVRGRTP